MTTKNCTQCSKEKPETKEYFFGNGKEGFRPECKDCFKKKRDSKPKKTREPKKIGTKNCNGPICNGKLLPVSSFNVDKTNLAYGLQNYCRNCKKHQAEENKNKHIDITEKICSNDKEGIISCGKKKPITDFSLNTYGLYGRHNQCKDCRSLNRKKINIPPITSGKKICKGSECLKEDKKGVEKDVSEFHSDKNSIQDGLYLICKECRKVRNAEYMSNLDNYVKLILKNAKDNVKRKAKDVQVKITPDDINDLYKKQDELCALTGMKMKHEMKITKDKKTHIVNPYNMSIDRIDPNKDYDKDNIQLVCSIINRMKYILSNQEFIDMCVKIDKYNKSKVKLAKQIVTTKQIKQYIGIKYCNMQGNAKKRSKEIDISITKQDIIDLCEKNCYCKITGIEMTYLSKTKLKEDGYFINNYNMSIDRIDSSGIYIKENVQLVCAIVNIMKSDLSNDEFIELCGKVAAHNK